ncbi:MAG TPA: NAD(+) kinase [Stenotrophobium sp.]|jgi:NAD+ kinase|nr:NAD(+) kinase [Stenotrophobium sp.]
MSIFKTVGLIGKQSDARVSQTLAQLAQLLPKLGCALLIETQSASALTGANCAAASRQELGQRCDLLIVVGGDGTLLAAARELSHTGLPILGINQGRLGFMVDVNPQEMEATLTQIFSGDYISEKRLLLRAQIRHADGRATSGSSLAVNDVVLRNQAAVRMLEFETWLGTEFISQHRADGIIVSTPTGSTAYALSGGGPVLHPSLDAITLVPICPHTLSDRPIVVGSDRVVRLVLCGGESTQAMVTCDGQTSEILSPGDAVEISRARETLHLIHPSNYNYFTILRGKLHWGRAQT